ncbi:MAG: GGDEF domain-containing protein [Desulfuromonas sp.]|nr:MAG: GGDEF domain-containing protein [Desulfuromonas sp.]
MGTLPLKPEELDDETLLSLDPIGIVSDTFQQILEHLNETNDELALAGKEIQTILDSAGAGILVVDHQMCLVAHNRKSQEMFFPDRDDVIGGNFRTVLCEPEDIPDECVFDQVVAARWTVEQTDTEIGGRHYHVVGAPIKNQHDEIVQVVLVYTDISERRQIELSLRETEHRLQTIVDSVQAGIVLVDPETHTIVEVNETALEMSGLSREEIIGMNCQDAICTAHKGLCPVTDLGKNLFNRECALRHVSRKNPTILKTVTEVTLRGRKLLLETFIDISARKKAEKALQESELRFRALYEQAPLAYQSLDNDGCFIEVNQAFLSMLGYTREEVIGRYFSEFMTPESARKQVKALPQFLETGVIDGVEFSLLDKGGEEMIVSVVGRVGTDGQGCFKQTHCILHNITERKRTEQKIEQLAYYDGLTELPNRALLRDRLHQVLAQAKRDASQVAILFLDLDRFKQVNDTQGHAVGDELLKMVADRLRSCVRSTDTVARLGGDEFVVVLTSITKMHDVTAMARKILDELCRPFSLIGVEIHSSGSIGVALYPSDGEDEETLLKNADTAMYAAKDHGRNNYQFFSEEMNRKAVERLAMENYLREALELDQLSLHYQPQLDLETGRMTGMEALLRWNHPDLGMISPATFIPLAEESGLIVPIGEWVLRSACRQAKAWQDNGCHVPRVAVNLSARQFGQPNLAASVDQILQETGLDPDCLELELTESGILESASDAILTLTDLKVRGIHLAIDDFGTGYSSLSYLKNFPIDRVKIAQTFVRDIPQDQDDAAIVEAVIMMAKSLRLRVIAEGVETKEQLAFLRERGCNEMQGYYFSRPLTVDAMTKMMSDGVCFNRLCFFSSDDRG